MALDGLDPGARQLWPLIRDEVGATAGAGQDARRLQSVLQRRREKSRAFFSSASGEWDRLRAQLFGPHLHLTALLSLIDDRLTVGDLGCGTGQMSEALAPHVARVLAIDGSADMLRAARARLQGCPNVEIREGALEALPIEDGGLDAAIVSLVLHHQPEPARVIAEAARVLRPGGRLLVVDMLPHDRVEYQQQMGHVWLGFSEDAMRRYLLAAGFGAMRLQALPPDPEAEGPALFAATAARESAGGPTAAAGPRH
jgi:ArsR family transcriptional regulator